ncbi:MAG TPA: hypothetical protein VJS69_09620 [Candidatus Krumholzibacteria bacterium]|nr:hypothetical protein [Candidatus Krumholzibacteria bacterium]
MKQKLIIAALAVLIVIAGLFVYLYNSIDSIVKNGVERYGTEVCGTKVSVGSVDISLKNGTGTIHDLRVANPDGFSHDSAVVLGGATLVLDIGSLNRDPLVIKEIRVTGPVVSAEVDEKLATNVGIIRNHVENYQARAAKPGKQDSGLEKRIAIRSLVIDQGVLKGDATRIGQQKGQWDMPPIELSNLGGETGTRPEAMAKVISAALFARAEQVAGDHLKAAAVQEIKNEAEKKLNEILKK